MLNRPLHVYVLAVCMVFTAACESHPDVTFRDSGDAPLSILYTSPADVEMGVALDSPVTVVFSKKLDPTSLDSTSFSIALDGTALNATIAVSDHVATLTPVDGFEALRNYNVSLTTDISSFDGVALSSSHSFTFTTRDLLWRRVGTIPNPAPEAGDAFGLVVTAVAGNFVVAADQDDGLVVDGGSVYLYDGTSGDLVLAIENPAPLAGDRFGTSVTAVGANFVVTAPNDDPGGVVNAGSVYLFNGTTGALILAIPNPAPAMNDQFGFLECAAVGTNFVVAAFQDDPGGVVNAGSVYLYNSTTGALILAIPNPAPATGDAFGLRITAVGGNFVVTAPIDTPGGVSSAGSVYLYNGMTGGLILAIPNPAPGTDDQFGSPDVVALGNNFVVLDSQDDLGGDLDAGSVFLFNGTTGALILSIPNPDPGTDDYFGSGVTAVGGSFVVAAPGADPGGMIDEGSVYLYSAAGSPILAIANPAPAFSGNFGAESIIAVGENFVVAAPNQNDPGGTAGTGSVYLYEGATGALILNIPNPDAEMNDLFGLGMTAVGGHFVVAASRDDPDGIADAGSVYVYDGTSGALVRAIANPDPSTADQFGFPGVTAIGANFVVAAQYDDELGGVADSGSVFLYARQ